MALCACWRDMTMMMISPFLEVTWWWTSYVWVLFIWLRIKDRKVPDMAIFDVVFKEIANFVSDCVVQTATCIDCSCVTTNLHIQSPILSSLKEKKWSLTKKMWRRLAREPGLLCVSVFWIAFNRWQYIFRCKIYFECLGNIFFP